MSYVGERITAINIHVHTIIVLLYRHNWSFRFRSTRIIFGFSPSASSLLQGIVGKDIRSLLFVLSACSFFQSLVQRSHAKKVKESID